MSVDLQGVTSLYTHRSPEQWDGKSSRVILSPAAKQRIQAGIDAGEFGDRSQTQARFDDREFGDSGEQTAPHRMPPSPNGSDYSKVRLISTCLHHTNQLPVVHHLLRFRRNAGGVCGMQSWGLLRHPRAFVGLCQLESEDRR